MVSWRSARCRARQFTLRKDFNIISQAFAFSVRCILLYGGGKIIYFEIVVEIFVLESPYLKDFCLQLCQIADTRKLLEMYIHQICNKHINQAVIDLRRGF